MFVRVEMSSLLLQVRQLRNLQWGLVSQQLELGPYVCHPVSVFALVVFQEGADRKRCGTHNA